MEGRHVRDRPDRPAAAGEADADDDSDGADAGEADAEDDSDGGPMRVHQPTVLVLGATGTIGRSLVAELRADDAAGRLDLVAGVRRPDAGRVLGDGVRLRLVDLDLPEREGLGRLVAALRDVDRLFLLTGYDVRMLAQSKAVVDAAAEAGVGHVVHLGVHAAPGSSVPHHGWHQLVET